jgi:hypothetical protein
VGRDDATGAATGNPAESVKPHSAFRTPKFSPFIPYSFTR